MKKHQAGEIEALLRSREGMCMNACSRYLNRASWGSKVWTLGSGIPALVIYARNSLFPVLSGRRDIPPLHFLGGIFGMAPIHAVQGSIEDSSALEAALEKSGLNAAERIDYDLMSIDRPPSGYQSAGPGNLVIRKPEPSDMDAIAALHAAYEREEVIPSASELNLAVSRLNAERIFKNEQMLVAEINSRLVGKINTNAATFTRYQIGGVYVHPDYRGCGIACRMAGEFTALLQRGVSLFVKRSNGKARSVYSRIGFEISGDYRICYY